MKPKITRPTRMMTMAISSSIALTGVRSPAEHKGWCLDAKYEIERCTPKAELFLAETHLPSRADHNLSARKSHYEI